MFGDLLVFKSNSFVKFCLFVSFFNCICLFILFVASSVFPEMGSDGTPSGVCGHIPVLRRSASYPDFEWVQVRESVTMSDCAVEVM